MTHSPTTRFTRPLFALTIWVGLAIFLVALDIHFVSAKVGINNLFASMQASQGVFDGFPHWRIYQSRILGPYLIHGIEHLFSLSPFAAYLVFIASCLFITKLIVIRFGLRHTDGITPMLLMLLSQSLLFAMLLSNSWLYPWDISGLMLSTLFVVMVLSGAGWRWFLALAAFAFLNRESAVFICVWLFVQGLLGSGKGTGRKPPDIGMMAAAAVMALSGLAMTEWLRAHLLIREIGPELWHFTPAGTSWFHWQLKLNLAGFLSSLTSTSLNLPVIFYAFPLAGLAMAATIGIRCYPAYTALCLAFSANLICVFLFGILEESRVMIDIIPFFSIFLIYIATSTDFCKSCTRTQADEPLKTR